MMNALPFLKGSKWPRIGKPGGVSKFGFSEDEELTEQALGALMAAFDAKDHAAFIQALTALIHLIQTKESSDVEPQESPA